MGMLILSGDWMASLDSRWKRSSWGSQWRDYRIVEFGNCRSEWFGWEFLATGSAFRMKLTKLKELYYRFESNQNIQLSAFAILVIQLKWWTASRQSAVESQTVCQTNKGQIQYDDSVSTLDHQKLVEFLQKKQSNLRMDNSMAPRANKILVKILLYRHATPSSNTFSYERGGKRGNATEQRQRASRTWKK